MKTTFSEYDLGHVANSISYQWNEQLVKSCRERRLSVPARLGQGQVAIYDFNNGLGLILLKAKFDENWIWEFKSSDAAPLWINYVTCGKVSFNLGAQKEPTTLESLQCLITGNPGGSTEIITFEKDTETIFASLWVRRRSYLKYVGCEKSALSPEISQFFSLENRSQPMLHVSGFSLSSSELIQEIFGCKQEGLLRSTHVEARAIALLSMQLQRSIEEIQIPRKGVRIMLDDMEKIIRARHLLVERMQNPPTIEELSKIVGINQQKLKQGFKLIFSKTINQFLRNQRLEKARLLLLSGGYNIREVAALVGYENQSHFARLFKDKYGIMPGDYIRTIERALPEE
jgi:AraC-like DNA-binding protein